MTAPADEHAPTQAQGDDRLRRRGRGLEYATTAWNSLEAVVAIASGFVAGSRALMAFGLDSCVEVFASLVVIRHLRRGPGLAGPGRPLRLLAGAFLVLAAGLGADAVRGLVTGSRPARSPLGAVFLGVTVVVMVVLAAAKRRTGRVLGDRPLIANASMTLLDAGVAAGALAGLLLSTVSGWWWADPAVAALVAVVLAREGRSLWREGAPGVGLVP